MRGIGTKKYTHIALAHKKTKDDSKVEEVPEKRAIVSREIADKKTTYNKGQLYCCMPQHLQLHL